jgi:hypothetical protein
VEIHCGCLTLIIHFAEGSAFAYQHWFADGAFLVVEFVLGVVAIEIDEVEVVVVISSDDGVTVGRGSYIEPIENAFILDHIAQLTFEGFLYGDGVDWFFGVAYVPYFNC